MLAVQINKKQKLYVTFEDDTKPNRGGYYCQVYADEKCEYKIDDFTIHNSRLEGVENKMKRACVIANSVVMDRYGK